MSKFLSATAQVILFKSKKLKNGLHPVMLKITFKSKRKYYSTSFKMSAEAYDELYQKQRLSKSERDVRTQLDAAQIRAQLIVERIIEDQKSFSFSLFEGKFFSKHKNTDVYQLFEEQIAYYQSKGGLKSRDLCRSAQINIKKFWGKKELLLEDIDEAFLISYETHNAHLSPNTIGLYQRYLRVVINKAVEKEVIPASSNPFLKHKIPHRPGRKRALTKEVMTQIRNYTAEKYSYEWYAQQVFLFSYFCNGMNLKDIAHLKWTDINDGRIYFIRGKTINTVARPKIQSIKIEDPLQYILDALMKHKTQENDYVFPILSKGADEEVCHARLRDYVGVVNNNLKRIAKKLGIEKKFTFYSGRHSWATVLKRAGTDVALISEGLSHSSIRVTEGYLDSFGDDALDEANKLLL